jgi:hypothetical protein
MAIHRICGTVQVELVIDLPDNVTQQTRNVLIDVWRRAIQVNDPSAEARGLRSVTAGPSLSSLSS